MWPRLLLCGISRFTPTHINARLTQDILSHNEFRTEILSNVWKGFLSIAESALQVG